MRPCSLWLHLVEDENVKLQDGDLSASQQRHAASASRRPRISGWHLCPPDGLTRGSGSNSASTSGTAKNASRGSNPEARHLRGLTLADYPEKDREPPTLLAALPPAGLPRAKGSLTKCCVRLFAQSYNVSTARVTRCSGAALPGSRLGPLPSDIQAFRSVIRIIATTRPSLNDCCSTFAFRRGDRGKARRPAVRQIVHPFARLGNRDQKGLTAAGFDRRPIGRVSVGLWRPWRRRQIQSLCSFFRQFSVSRRLLQQIRLKRGILFCNGHFFKVDGPFEILRNQFHRRALWTQDEFGLSPFSPNHVCLAASKCKEFNHAPRPDRGAAPP